MLQDISFHNIVVKRQAEGLEVRKLRVCAVSCMLPCVSQGPIEVGNMILAREGVLEMLLTMANSSDFIHTVSHNHLSTPVRSLCLRSRFYESAQQR